MQRKIQNLNIILLMRPQYDTGRKDQLFYFLFYSLLFFFFFGFLKISLPKASMRLLSTSVNKKQFHGHFNNASAKSLIIKRSCFEEKWNKKLKIK